MKTLQQFILEEYKTFRVKNLEVSFYVTNNDNNNYIIFKVPETYSEDNFQIYLQDTYLNDFPAGDKYSKDFFGDNTDNIFDVFFEYEKYEKSDDEPEDFIDWDDKYDNKVDDKTDFAYVKVTDLKYIIKFDSFDLKEENEDQIYDTLKDIFKTCENSSEHDWKLQLKLDEDNIKYE